MILAITNLPLYSSNDDNIIFLFGETNLKHRCCVVSSLKLKENFYNRQKNRKLFEQRLIKEITHEIGHLILGPEHCYEETCVMQYSTEVKEIDNKDKDLCNKCKLKLKQLRESYNF
jgi:archaemetzincin